MALALSSQHSFTASVSEIKYITIAFAVGSVALLVYVLAVPSVSTVGKGLYVVRHGFSVKFCRGDKCGPIQEAETKVDSKNDTIPRDRRPSATLDQVSCWVARSVVSDEVRKAAEIRCKRWREQKALAVQIEGKKPTVDGTIGKGMQNIIVAIAFYGLVFAFICWRVAKQSHPTRSVVVNSIIMSIGVALPFFVVALVGTTLESIFEIKLGTSKMAVGFGVGAVLMGVVGVWSMLMNWFKSPN